MQQAAKILEEWGFAARVVLQQYDVAGGRLVYSVQAGEQALILKGQPWMYPKKSCVRWFMRTNTSEMRSIWRRGCMRRRTEMAI